MRRAPRHPTRLAVTLRFEPNRLSPEYLADAYERVAPISRRQLVAEVGPSPILGVAGGGRVKEVA